MEKRIWVWFMILLILGSAPYAFAAETGTIKGKVLTKQGELLPGVTITLEGSSMQGKRTMISGEDGSFRFPIVPVGRYTLTFELMGFATLKQENVPVGLGATTPLEVTLDSARFEKEITVTAEAPLIEKDSGDLSTRLSSEKLESMPSADRSFRDIAKFVPGVTGVRINTVDGNTDNGMPSIRGEGQYGNNYLVDGLSVRDPAVNSTGAPLNFDAIEEIQIITDGFSPEYGRALGGTVNVITKSGSNDFHGEAAIQYESDVLNGEEKDSLWAQNRDFTKLLPYANLGGPILQDRLWFFVSYNYEDNVQKYDIADYTKTDSNLFTKLTLAINPVNTLSVAGSFRGYEDENSDIDAGRTKEALGSLTRDDVRIRANYKSIISDMTVLEAKYGYIRRESDDDPQSGDPGPAQRTDLDTNTIYGNYDAFDHQTRDRDDISLELTQFIDEFMGTHEFKGGLLYEKTASTRTMAFTGVDEDIFPDRMEGGAEIKFRDGVPNVYYDYQGATVENETDGYGVYLQDKWAPVDNLKLMLGFRIDSQDVKNNVGDTLFKFNFDETFAPRVTAAYDMTRDGRNVFKFGAGRFYDVVSTSLAEWGNTANPYSYDMYQYGGPGNPYTGGTYTPGDEWNPNNWGTWYDTDDDGERDTFVPGEIRYTQDPVTNPLTYSDDLKPYYKDEVLVEYDRGIGNDYAAKIRFIRGWTRDLIEDVAYTIDDWYIVNFDRKKRDYKAVELEFAGQPTEDLSFNFAYIWTDNEGTTPGQFEKGGFGSDWGSGNTVGVFGDRPPWDEDPEYSELLNGLGGLDGDDGWYGPLPYATDHQILLNVTYRAPWDVIVGSGMEWNSGYHWQQRGWQEAYGGYLTFPEGRGAREMPSLFFWDLSLAKKFEFGNNLNLTARADVFNVLDLDKAISYNQDWDEGGTNENFGAVLKRQDPRSIRLSLSFAF